MTAEPLPPPTVPGLSPPPQTPTQPGSATPPGPTLPAVSPEPGIPGATPVRPQLAALPGPAPAAAPAVAQPATRTGLTGSWAARDGAGGSCRVLLSGSPSLDLYKASASACANKDLAKVNAWELRDGEIYLYSAGAVVARLQAQGRTASGALVRSGAPITMSR